jgi:hypothetical protein
MSRIIEHFCPICRTEMEKIIIEIKEPYEIYDPSTMGINTTGSVQETSFGSSGCNASSLGKSGTSGYKGISPSEGLEEPNTQEIILIPYECPKCKYQKSFDE